MKRRIVSDTYLTDSGSGTLWSDLSSDGKRLFVANFYHHTVSVFNTESGGETVGIAMGAGCNPASVTLLADDSYALVPCFGTGRINVVETSTNILWGFMGLSIDGGGIDSIAVNKAGTKGYVTSFSGNEVWVLSDLP